MPAPLTSQVPLLIRGGSILPTRERVRRAAELGWKDPFTLTIALNKPFTSSSSTRGGSLRAIGKLYLDDGDTYNYESGDFVWKRFEWHTESNRKKHSLRSTDESTHSSSDSTQVSAPVKSRGNDNFVKSISDVRIERLVILGLEEAPKAIKVGGESLQFTWTSGVSASGSLLGGKASELVVKDPKVLVVQDWDIQFE